MNGGNSGFRMTGRPAGSPHVEPLLGAYVLGVLVPEEEARVAGHLTHCGRCRAVYLGMADAQALRAACAEEDAIGGGAIGTNGTDWYGGSGGVRGSDGVGGVGDADWYGGGTGRNGGGTGRNGGGTGRNGRGTGRN
ncbi:anti-sigma factor family protein [Streptomyces tirandamycinicus]|uniref:anti-sigma factor family protein n=1 Tax=Streptomyces tirandamycinicus TaxID=2174846 RepID=UPI00244A8B53|nr:zf-HC2 domain-containing protein [Streptomyces tirandamycinicus]